MPVSLDSTLRDLLKRFKGYLKSSPRVRRLLYDVENEGAFTGLDWHERMLSDEVRVRSYRAGIASGIRPGDVVIDLGTGTGVLAAMAAAAGARRVYAVDHSRFIHVSEALVRASGYDNVTFVRANSRDFTCPEPADVILHEQMGHTLFGERMVWNLLDLKRRCLKPGGRILPARFELLAVPVAVEAEYRRPFLWEIEGTDLALRTLRDSPLLAPYRTAEHGRRLLKSHEVERFLASPRALVRVDLNHLASEEELEARHVVEWTCHAPGTVDGILFYFRTWFDGGAEFDTSPFNRQTNWENMLLRTERTPVAPGATLSCTLALDPLSESLQWRVSGVSCDGAGARGAPQALAQPALGRSEAVRAVGDPAL